MLRVLYLLFIVGLFASRVAAADPAQLLRALDTDDPKALGQAIGAIEGTASTSDPAANAELADVLFAAGRACEDRLYEPARALALYERIVREMPDAGVSIAAGRRIGLLRDAREHAREAAELAQLIATADALPANEVERRAEALTLASWPGATDAALFLADWLCRTGRFADAQARYAALLVKTPDAEQAHLARRNAAGCAIDAKDWVRAEQLAEQLVGGDEVDEAVRMDLLESVATGRQRAWLYRAAWLALLLAGCALLASLGEAIARGGLRSPGWQPPVEVLFIAPVAIVVIAAAFAVDILIAPAVIEISVAGVLAAWISGTTLDLLRRRERPVRLRSLAHVLACGLLVLSIGYIAMTRDGLLDLLTETVRYGPGS